METSTFLSSKKFLALRLSCAVEAVALSRKRLYSADAGLERDPPNPDNEAFTDTWPPMTTKPAGPTPTRRYPRYPMDIRVSAKVFRADNPVELWGRSIEFGQDGIGVTLTGELQTGEVATLELTLPASTSPLKLRALVRYRDGLRHGFEFLARDEIQREVIRRACEVLAAGR